jgi:hypothetical protein
MAKAQAAIEYLTTYGWAILIIVAAAGILYSLGVFNSGSFSGKSTPGACQVYRPYGPGTIQLVNLQGVCNAEQPRAVGFFNGQNSNINFSNSQYMDNPTQLTVSMWMYANGIVPVSQSVFGQDHSGAAVFTFPTTSDGWAHIVFSILSTGKTLSVPYSGIKTWHNVVATYNGVTMSIYVDGVLSGSMAATGNIAWVMQNLTLGSVLNTQYFAGRISNVQIYNASLSANQINSQFIRGIGAPPQVLQNLVGWWPLNADVVDYSGNGNNGVTNSIFFSTTWNNGYTGH